MDQKKPIVIFTLERSELFNYPNIDITFVIKGEPILNDCLVEDASACGLAERAEIISSGVLWPGQPLDRASEKCRQLFDHADVILSKGQENFKALSDQYGSFCLCQSVR